MTTLLIILVVLYLSVRAYLRSFTKSSVLMPDGRRWTSRNLNIPLLGWKNPEATPEEWRYYNFLHVKIINALFRLFAVGWHIPDDGEWTTMIEAVGEDAGRKLKSKDGWKDGGNGADEFGFRVLPGGYRLSNGSNFANRGTYAFFWSSSATSSTSAWIRNFYYYRADVARTYDYRSIGFSVRLIKNK